MSNEAQLLSSGQAVAPLPYFTHLLETPYGYTKFHFNRIHTVEGIQYHVSFKPLHKKAYHLQLAQMLNHWQITPITRCPLWIKVLQPDLEKAVMESLRM